MFSLSSSRVCCDPTKTGTGRRALPEIVGEDTHCYTLEVSFFCYQVCTCARRALLHARVCACCRLLTFSEMFWRVRIMLGPLCPHLWSLTWSFADYGHTRGTVHAAEPDASRAVPRCNIRRLLQNQVTTMGDLRWNRAGPVLRWRRQRIPRNPRSINEAKT